MPSPEQVAAAVTGLAIDQTTVEVSGALARAQVEHVVLKGPSFRLWLYPGGQREYADTDLLLRPDQEQAAASVLLGIGFRPDPGPGRGEHGVAELHLWRRDDRIVEMHVTLIGINAAPEVVWDVLARDPDSLELGGRAVPVLREEARALHAVLHAAQHGREHDKPMEDLRRVVERLEVRDWERVVDSAERLQALPALRVGLALLPESASLAARLQLAPVEVDTPLLLRAASAHTTAFGVDRLMSTPGTTLKVRRLLQSAFPTPQFMRWWSPLARKGALGLAAAYVYRPIWGAVHLPGAVRTWHAAKREVRQGAAESVDRR